MRYLLPAVYLAPSRLDELQKRYEENPRRFFAPLANEHRKAGDLDSAIALCQEHLDGQPGNMNGHVVYGQALFDAGRYDEADATFVTALGLDPENLIALRHLGDIARLTGKPDKAVEWYSRVLEADPRNDEILAFLGEVKAAATPAPDVAASPTAPAADAPTIEIRAAARTSLANVTPIAPVETIPVKRPSLHLIDVDMSFGEVEAPTAGLAPAASREPVSPPEVPIGDIELSDLNFDPSDPAALPESSSDPAASTAGTPIESALGWDMGGNVDLDAGPIGGGDDAVAATPEVFVTETMAELYLQQGFRDEALDVYRQLSAMNPGDQSLIDRIRRLEDGSRASMSFEQMADVEPDFAPGTDSLIPVHDAAATPGDLGSEPLLAAAPEFDVSTDAASEPLSAPAAELVPEPAVELVPAPAAELVPEPAVELVPAPAAEFVPEPAAELVPEPAAPVRTARGFFAALAQRKPLRRDGTAPAGISTVPAYAAPGNGRPSGSLDALFGTSVGGSDDAMAEALATAVGVIETAVVRGRPTQAAASELSLDSVFRGETPLRVSGPVVRQSSMLKFDQFFAIDDEPAAAPAPKADDVPAAPADDAQFQSWLEGLQGKGQ